MSTLKNALEVIEKEELAIKNLRQFLDADFDQAVHLIHQSKGRVILTGIGKSAIIAQKIVATFNSTGTPALYMHGVDAIHGDLGMIQRNDVVIILSKSGTSSEIKALIPLIKKGGNSLIALTGNADAPLAKQADLVLRSDVEKEACPFNLAPTASSTAQMVMGDALAICLLKMKNFEAKDFAQFHPGGALGKKLYLKVEDLCQKNEVPAVETSASISEVLEVITSKRLGATAVLIEDQIVGIITDGDIRRMLLSHKDITKIMAKDIMSAKPKKIELGAFAIDAYQLMKAENINHILVLSNGKYFGMIHIQDLINEGIV